MPVDIHALVKREYELKDSLKDIRSEIKAAIEETRLYKQVLETTMQAEYEVSEKTAKAHAFKVVRASYDEEEA
jgi:hypothetical protein